jgi:hypothetical protein
MLLVEKISKDRNHYSIAIVISALAAIVHVRQSAMEKMDKDRILHMRKSKR